MPCPKMTSEYWICPICQNYKSFRGTAFLVGRPIVHMICSSCIEDLEIHPLVFPRVVRTAISLPIIAVNQVSLADAISYLEDAGKLEVR